MRLSRTRTFSQLEKHSLDTHSLGICARISLRLGFLPSVRPCFFKDTELGDCCTSSLAPIAVSLLGGIVPYCCQSADCAFCCCKNCLAGYPRTSVSCKISTLPTNPEQDRYAVNPAFVSYLLCLRVHWRLKTHRLVIRRFRVISSTRVLCTTRIEKVRVGSFWRVCGCSLRTGKIRRATNTQIDDIMTLRKFSRNRQKHMLRFDVIVMQDAGFRVGSRQPTADTTASERPASPDDESPALSFDKRMY